MSPLTNDEKSWLLRLARRSMEAVVCARTLEALANVPVALRRPSGAFVSLHHNGSLRGCVGFVAPAKPLYETVIEAATAAAVHDTRFLPVSPPELPGLAIEISILSPLYAVRPEQIEVGTHGLMVTLGEARGLLLPQVAAERNWNRLRFLDEACRKAGLAPGAWHHGAKIEAFTAEVFSEHSVPCNPLPI